MFGQQSRYRDKVVLPTEQRWFIRFYATCVLCPVCDSITNGMMRKTPEKKLVWKNLILVRHGGAVAPGKSSGRFVRPKSWANSGKWAPSTSMVDPKSCRVERSSSRRLKTSCCRRRWAPWMRPRTSIVSVGASKWISTVLWNWRMAACPPGAPRTWYWLAWTAYVTSSNRCLSVRTKWYLNPSSMSSSHAHQYINSV